MEFKRVSDTFFFSSFLCPYVLLLQDILPNPYRFLFVPNSPPRSFSLH